jgi:cell fate (sporulation/competence/biofilm development) regulator YlbF (YheA/YmcA/DUF963 family)
MSNVCALPIRYSAGAAADPGLVAAVHDLADAIEGSDEFQAFARLAQEVNEDAQVADLLEQIRLRHSQYSHAKNGELVAALEGLPVMLAYRQAELDLRALCAEVDRMISAEAGMTYSLTVRPQGHG